MKRHVIMMAAIVSTLFVLTWSTEAFAQDALSQADMQAILSLLAEKKWAALGGVFIFTAMRFVKSDVKPTFLNVPPRARILVVWMLSILSLVVDKIAEGIPWRTAVTNMAISLVVSVVILHQTFIASWRAGKELPVPFLTIPGMRPSPTAPATITPPDPPPVVIPGTGDGAEIDASLKKQTEESRDSSNKDPG